MEEVEEFSVEYYMRKYTKETLAELLVETNRELEGLQRHVEVEWLK